MNKLIFMAPLALFACSNDAETPPPAIENETVETPAAEPAELALAGNYDVITYRGAALGKPVSATFDESTLTISTDCANMIWSYEANGNIVSFTPASGTSVGCAARSTTVESGIAELVGMANIAMEMNGGIQLSGAGGALDLMPR